MSQKNDPLPPELQTLVLKSYATLQKEYDAPAKELKDSITRLVFMHITLNQPTEQLQSYTNQFCDLLMIYEFFHAIDQ